MKNSTLLSALTIFTRHAPNESFCSAEHDEIYVSKVNPMKMTPLELAKLKELGFSWDAGVECWRHYV